MRTASVHENAGAGLQNWIEYESGLPLRGLDRVMTTPPREFPEPFLQFPLIESFHSLQLTQIPLDYFLIHLQ